MVAISGAFGRVSKTRRIPAIFLGAAAEIGLVATASWPSETCQIDDRLWPFFLLHWHTDRPRSPLSCDPFFSDKYNLAIIADVRLDDRTNLCALLGMVEPTSRNLPDLHLLLAAYAKWGADCPKYLIGDYAFAIWDARNETLFCARDHIGAKPFYYGCPNGSFVFSSDIRIVLSAYDERPLFDEDYIAHGLVDWHYSSLKKTAFQGILKLPPAHSLTLNSGNVEIKRYWDPHNLKELKYANDDQYAEALFGLFEKAVLDRLRSGYNERSAKTKFGVHVSGGLDSSAIAAIANDDFHARSEPLPAAFSWQPPPDLEKPLSPEHSRIEAMAEDQKMDVQYIPPNSDDVYNLFLRDGTFEPVGGTLLNEEAIQKAAADQNISVILSGWGGDEFASHNGRALFPELLRRGRWRQLVRELKQLDQPFFKSIIGQAVIPAYLAPLAAKWTRLRGRNRRKPQRSFIDSDFQKRIRPKKSSLPNFLTTRELQLSLLADGHITQRIEQWAANAFPLGIEYRYPLLDRRVMEFALSIPSSQYKRGRWKRWVFRNAMKNVLPDTVLWNLSKVERERTDALLEPIALAFGRLGDDLRSGAVATTRGQYVDMDRLTGCMDADKFRASGRLGPTRAAVEFLDFK